MINWFLNYKDQFSGEIQEFEWHKRWNLKIFDFEVKLQTPNGEAIGRSLDPMRTSALEKALAECFERAICLEHKIPSNGVAAHTDLQTAQSHARNEFIERDLYLCHFYSNSEVKVLAPILKFGELISSFEKKHQTTIRFLLIAKANGLFVISCEAASKNQTFGVILGLGTSESLEAAKEKAFLECLMNLIPFVEGNIEQVEMSEDNVKSSLDNFHNALSPSYFRSVTETDEIEEQNFDYAIQLSELHSQCHPFSELPLKFARATSENAQNLFFGIPMKESINLDRLKKFSDKIQTFDDINPMIHPIG